MLDDFFTLVEFDVVDSTNDVAKEMAEAGASSGTLIWAKEQTRGKGRRGRKWISPRGNLCCSIILRPNALPHIAAQLSFVTAVAFGESIYMHLNNVGALSYKWPNDVLVNEKKVSGILLESQVGQLGLVDWVIVGVGANVSEFPSISEYPATSLKKESVDLGIEEVLVGYSHHLRKWISTWEIYGFEPVRLAWLGRATGLGRSINVRLPQETLSGIFESIDETGALILVTPDGERLISAGEVYVSE